MQAIDRMREIIGLSHVDNEISFNCLQSVDCGLYYRKRIEYVVNGHSIPAFLLIPKGDGQFPAVLINHQHNSERHFGKSEVCGIVGNPLQAFGPALAERGFVVIAPDSICFEERRINANGTDENARMDDWHHFLALCHGVLTGDTLAKTVIEDAMGAISVINKLEVVNKESIGCLGHSYGGNTTCFTTAFDKRIGYALASGSLASYKYRMENLTGIEMASIIPGFLKEFEICDVVKEISPRNFMIVCSDADKYSKDAPTAYEIAKERYISDGAKDNLQIKQYVGGHALTQERFEFIVDWVTNQVKDNHI